jgi:hypothetical protein
MSKQLEEVAYRAREEFFNSVGPALWTGQNRKGTSIP